MAAGQDRKAAANKLYSEKKYEDAVLSFTSLIDDVAFDFPDLAVYHSNRSGTWVGECTHRWIRAIPFQLEGGCLN